jgi:hypothetical protein
VFDSRTYHVFCIYVLDMSNKDIATGRGSGFENWRDVCFVFSDYDGLTIHSDASEMLVAVRMPVICSKRLIFHEQDEWCRRYPRA